MCCLWSLSTQAAGMSSPGCSHDGLDHSVRSIMIQRRASACQGRCRRPLGLSPRPPSHSVRAHNPPTTITSDRQRVPTPGLKAAAGVELIMVGATGPAIKPDRPRRCWLLNPAHTFPDQLDPSPTRVGTLTIPKSALGAARWLPNACSRHLPSQPHRSATTVHGRGTTGSVGSPASPAVPFVAPSSEPTTTCK